MGILTRRLPHDEGEQWIREKPETPTDGPSWAEAPSEHADWAEAWMALDALMHKTCHAASDVSALRARGPSLANDKKILALVETLKTEHQQWKDRAVVRKGVNWERYHEYVRNDAELNSATNLVFMSTGARTTEFGDYDMLTVVDPVFAGRLNNWRAVRLYISLICEPMWDSRDCSRLVCAVDLCRTHAALEARNKFFLGAEKSVGLFLAGVIFGGPDLYSVLPLARFLRGWYV